MWLAAELCLSPHTHMIYYLDRYLLSSHPVQVAAGDTIKIQLQLSRCSQTSKDNGAIKHSAIHSTTKYVKRFPEGRTESKLGKSGKAS